MEQFESAGWLKPAAKKSYQFPLWEQDTPGVNARGLLVIETEDYGNVALIPLGMSEVSTVTFHTEKVRQGAALKKGEEVGMFNYGLGSGAYPTNIGSQIGVWKPRSC